MYVDRTMIVASSAAAAVVLFIALPTALISRAETESPAPVENPAPSLLAARGIHVTEGAAAGYVADEVCGRCHQDLYHSFQEVGMGRSFSAPSTVEVIEDFDAEPYFHEPSQRWYEMRRRDDGEIRFRRFQLDHEGKEINVFEQKVDWILGSGHRSRTYLYRTPLGELFMLPIAWYLQPAAWRMAPGFDWSEHMGVRRRIQRECMFCHNAYPEVAAGSDEYLQPQLFPDELPHGIGCQRCHGPGAAHVAEGMSDIVDFGALASSILNPADLEIEQQREVCYQCHMQPSVGLMGIRRFGRNTYSYRPGEPLADYLVQIDVEEDGTPREERFEINHHPYRLEQSNCFQQSADELTCLTCHDPHRKVPVPERPAHYREACLGCHQLDDCDLDAMAAESPLTHSAAAEANDCVACHMPQRRTQDVVEVVMTDHLIQRRPAPAEDLLAPLPETDPVIVDAQLMDPDEDLKGALGEVYRAMTVLRSGGTAEAGSWLAKQLQKARPDHTEPYLDLARWRYREGRYDEAADLFGQLMEKHPWDARVIGLLAVTESARGENAKAIALARRALMIDAERPESHYNLGRLLLSQRGPAPAIPHLREAVRIRPNLERGWFQLGIALGRQGQRDEAADALRQAVTIEPSFSEAYGALVQLLTVEGHHAEADRYRRHAQKLGVFPDNEPQADNPS